MDSALVIGITGMLCLLIAFVLNEIHKMKSDHPVYLWLNVIGCVLLAWYAFQINSPPFLVLEIVWGFFAVYGLLKFRK